MKEIAGEENDLRRGIEAVATVETRKDAKRI